MVEGVGFNVLKYTPLPGFVRTVFQGDWVCGCVQLRPLDARMWCAMGQCYEHEQLGMDEAATRCYQRAQSAGDREGESLGGTAHARRCDLAGCKD